MIMQNLVAYMGRRDTATEESVGVLSEKTFRRRVQAMASGHQRAPDRGGARELVITDMIREPILRTKPGMVSYVPDSRQLYIILSSCFLHSLDQTVGPCLLHIAV